MKDNSYSSIDELVEKHKKLDKEVNELSSCNYLSQHDIIRLKSLKVQKLRIKDTINFLKRQSLVNEQERRF